MRQLSEAARCAKIIRSILKEKFPKTTFKVTSDNFSMGDSVDIRYNNGPTYDQVNSITKQYQDGSFDGMIDLYEYRPNPNNIPRAKYVMVQRNISEIVYQATKNKIAREYGFTDPTNEQEWRSKTGEWSNCRVGRELRDIDLTNIKL